MPTLADLPEWARLQADVAKKALVIGIGDYCQAECLPTPTNDVILMTKALKDLHFDSVTPYTNLQNHGEVMAAIGAFRATLQPGDMCVFYYSGHGVERSGFNYLVPAAAKAVKAQSAGYEYVGLQQVLEELGRAKPGFIFVVLDACRTDPFAGQTPPEEVFNDDAPTPASAPAGGERCVLAAVTPTTTEVVAALAQPGAATPAPPARGGLAQVQTPSGTLIAYAAALGQPAATLAPGDSVKDGSLYTRYLARKLQPQKTLSWILDEATADLSEHVHRDQTPWMGGVGGGGGQVMLQPDEHELQEERQVWLDSVRRGLPDAAGVSQTADQARSELRKFLIHYPIGRFATAARRRLDQPDSEYIPRFDQRAELAFNLANLPDGERLFSGDVASPSAFSTARSAASAATRRPKVLYSSASILGRRGIVSLPTGTEVKVLQSTSNNWAQVQTASGEIGYLSGVVTHDLNSSQAIDIAFVGSEADAPIAKPEMIKTLVTKAMSSRDTVVVRVASANNKDAARANQVSYLRSLTLSRLMEAQGLPAYRITLISGPLDDVPVDTARVTFVPT